MKHWLDKYIKEQKKQRNIIGKNSAELQEMSERYDWDKTIKRKRKR